MATLLRSRRFADRASEATQKYIAFPIRQYWFALPIQVLQRVSNSKESDNADSPQAQLVTQNSNEYQPIDLEQRLFFDAAFSNIDLKGLVPPMQTSCLILFKSSAGETFGIKIEEQPTMQRVAQSQISPLAMFDFPISLQSVCSSVIQIPGAAPIFLLEVDKLSDTSGTL